MTIILQGPPGEPGKDGLAGLKGPPVSDKLYDEDGD